MCVLSINVPIRISFETYFVIFVFIMARDRTPLYLKLYFATNAIIRKYIYSRFSL